MKRFIRWFIISRIAYWFLVWITGSVTFLQRLHRSYPQGFLSSFICRSRILYVFLKARYLNGAIMVTSPRESRMQEGGRKRLIAVSCRLDKKGSMQTGRKINHTLMFV